MEKTSITTCFNYDIPIMEQIKLVGEAGFSHISFGMNYSHSGLLKEDKLNELCIALKEAKLLVDTVHGYDLDRKDAIEINEMVAKAAKQLGSSIVVVHCSAFEFPDKQYEEKLKLVSQRIKDIEKIAEKYGIKFALENVVVGLPTKLCEKILDIADKRFIGFCYDSSHDQIDGPRNMDLLKRQKDRIIAVHLSDRIKEFVDHVVPGEGFIDFDEMLFLLKQSSFDGPVLMEVEMTHSRFKDVYEFLDEVRNSAGKIARSLGLK